MYTACPSHHGRSVSANSQGPILLRLDLSDQAVQENVLQTINVSALLTTHFLLQSSKKSTEI